MKNNLNLFQTDSCLKKGMVVKMKYRCTICGDIYDEEQSGVKFEELPEDWTCPVCGVGKDMFEKVEE